MAGKQVQSPVKDNQEQDCNPKTVDRPNSFFEGERGSEAGVANPNSTDAIAVENFGDVVHATPLSTVDLHLGEGQSAKGSGELEKLRKLAEAATLLEKSTSAEKKNGARRRSTRNKPPPPPKPLKKARKQPGRKSSKVNEPEEAEVKIQHTPGFDMFLDERRSGMGLKGKDLPPKLLALHYALFSKLSADEKEKYEKNAKEEEEEKEEKEEEEKKEDKEEEEKEEKEEAEEEEKEEKEEAEEHDSIEEDEEEEEKEEEEKKEDKEADEDYQPAEEEEEQGEEEEEAHQPQGGEGKTEDSDEESHHGNAMNAFVRFKNVWIHKLKKTEPKVCITDEYRRQMRADWNSLSEERKEIYLTGAAQERQKRKAEGLLKRKPTGEKDKLKKKKAEAKLKGKSEKKLKNPRRYQSYMSLPSVISLFKDLTVEQRAWLNEVGLGGLAHLKISETPEAFNQFIYKSFDTDGSLTAHGRTVEITPEVVGWLFGIRCTGVTEFPEVEPAVLGELQRRLGLSTKTTKCSEYKLWFKADENKELCNEEWKQRAVCLILGAMGMPIGAQGIRQGTAKLVADLEHLKKVNWAELWLDHFKAQNVKSQSGDTLRGSGCVLIPVVMI